MILVFNLRRTKFSYELIKITIERFFLKNCWRQFLAPFLASSISASCCDYMPIAEQHWRTGVGQEKKFNTQVKKK